MCINIINGDLPLNYDAGCSTSSELCEVSDNNPDASQTVAEIRKQVEHFETQIVAAQTVSRTEIKDKPQKPQDLLSNRLTQRR